MSEPGDRTERRLQRIEEAVGFGEMATQELTEQGREFYKRLEALDRRMAALERRLEEALSPDPEAEGGPASGGAG